MNFVTKQKRNPDLKGPGSNRKLLPFFYFPEEFIKLLKRGSKWRNYLHSNLGTFIIICLHVLYVQQFMHCAICSVADIKHFYGENGTPWFWDLRCGGEKRTGPIQFSHAVQTSRRPLVPFQIRIWRKQVRFSKWCYSVCRFFCFISVSAPNGATDSQLLFFNF